MGVRVIGAKNTHGMDRCELTGGPADGAAVWVYADTQYEVLFAGMAPNGQWTFSKWPAPGRCVYIRLEERRDRYAYEGVFREVPFGP